MLIEVSIGEALDKLTILEIKSECIQDTLKLIEIHKEINALVECKQALNNPIVAYIYKLLKWINKRVWDFTNTIKEMSADVSPIEFAKLSHIIFEHNQYRFRCKNMINSFSSGIKEQKSYKETSIVLSIDSTEFIHKVYVACLLFDRVYLLGETNPIGTPNITMISSNSSAVPISLWEPQELDCNDPIF
jgi:hypothetical protein